MYRGKFMINEGPLTGDHRVDDATCSFIVGCLHCLFLRLKVEDNGVVVEIAQVTSSVFVPFWSHVVRGGVCEGRLLSAIIRETHMDARGPAVVSGSKIPVHLHQPRHFSLKSVIMD